MGVFRNKIIEANSFDVHNGTSQLWVLFGDDLIKSLNAISLSKKDKEWADKHEQLIDWAIKYRDDVINTVVSYGKKETCEIALQEFGLADTMRDMIKKGEKFKEY